MTFFRDARRSLQEVCRILYLKVSTLAQWNGLFDGAMRPFVVPDRRGKAAKVTAALVRKVVLIARAYIAAGTRLRLKAFTRHLAGKEIELSSKTVGEILTANDLYGVRVKNRRPRFYQNLRQTIPNGLVAVDGKEFVVVLGADTHRFNLELCVDVKSFVHSGFSVADTETSQEFIKVLEMHRQAWGNPLAVVMDHGRANLSDNARTYLDHHDIVMLPAGPANPKGNGSVEGAFSEMAEVIGAICIDTSNPRALAQNILEKIASVYMTMRNRLPKLCATLSPLGEMAVPVTEQQRVELKQRYRQRARKKAGPDESSKHARINWVIEHHQLAVDEPTLKRAIKCIAHYDIKVIAKAEAAFNRAISRDERKKNLPYFFGILRNMQEEADTARHKEYCRLRYEYEQISAREQLKEQENKAQLSPHVMVDMLHAAITLPIASIKEHAMRQVDRMVEELKRQYRYLGNLKKKILEALASFNNISVAHRQEMIVWTEGLTN